VIGMSVVCMNVKNYKLRSKEMELNEEMNYLEAIKRLKKNIFSRILDKKICC